MNARERVLRQQGYNEGRCVGLWDAVEIAQEHEERRSKGGVISENIRAEALHADKVKAADAIPDARPCLRCCELTTAQCNDCGMLRQAPAPMTAERRAELVEVMCEAFYPALWHALTPQAGEDERMRFSRVLDALIKAGAVR